MPALGARAPVSPASTSYGQVIEYIQSTQVTVPTIDDSNTARQIVSTLQLTPNLQTRLHLFHILPLQ